MYLFFDTETTGKPNDWNAPISNLDNWPRLVQIAWLEFDNSGVETSSHDYIIKPHGFTIPPESTEIHGISTKKAINEGFPLKEVLDKFSGAINQSKVIVAHNMSFDEKIIGAEFLRENISNSLFDKSRVCTMKLSTKYCQIPGTLGYKWPSLPQLHSKLFNTGFEEVHNAVIDARVCAKCFFELKRLGIIKQEQKEEAIS